ncbi:MAG TPA: hypothetical protein VFR47_10245 [Anaerolineales bacterium]|nr:hypothetical protein [Anaerolineales bacterium]
MEIRYLGIAQRAKARRVFLVLEVSFKTLSIYLPGPDHDPRNAESGDRSYQLRACAFPVSGNSEVKAFAEADVMPGVMKLGFEVDQIDVHLHGHLHTKEGLPRFEQPFFFYLESFMFLSSVFFCVLSLCQYRSDIGIATSLLDFDFI